MAEIIKFPNKQNEDDMIIDKFIESLNDWQKEQFFMIIEQAKKEYDTLYETAQDIAKKYIAKVQECERLKGDKK